MTRQAKVELRDLHIAASIGTYRPDEIVPDAHILNLMLMISPDLVQVAADDMAGVFDYDPLISQIDEIARSQKFETQEYLMSLIVNACAAYRQIEAVDISMRKQPVRAGTGSLGVRLSLGTKDMAKLRKDKR